MINREDTIQKLVSKLQSVQNLDEFKSSEEEIIDLMDRYIKSAIDSLKDFLENMFSMTPEEREEKAQFFQDDSFPFEPKVEKEMKRLDTLPGFLDYADVFGPKMEKMMEPHMNQYAEYMEKVMSSLMGGVGEVMEGMMEGVAQAFGTPEVDEGTEEEASFEFDYDNPDTPAMLYDLYYSRDLETLRENKENLIGSVEEQLQEDIWDLEVLRDMPAEELFDSDKEKIAKIQKHMERLEPEMEKEFARLEALPEAAEEVKAIRTEMTNRLIRKIRTVRGYLRNLN